MAEIEEIALNDDELICVLTGDKKKASPKEQILQSIILQMNEEYGFEMSDMKRDYSFSYENEEGKKKRMTIDLAIFRADAAKEPENLERICFVYDAKVKAGDNKKGVEAALLAPTAVNQQKFYLTLDGNKVKAKAGLGPCAKMDLGIVKYHFELGAGKENFEWA